MQPRGNHCTANLVGLHEGLNLLLIFLQLNFGFQYQLTAYFLLIPLKLMVMIKLCFGHNARDLV